MSSQLIRALDATRATQAPGSGGRAIIISINQNTLEPREITLTQYDLMDLHRVARKWQRALGDDVILLSRSEWEILIESWMNQADLSSPVTQKNIQRTRSGWQAQASKI